jgi:hypothetical protein
MHHVKRLKEIKQTELFETLPGNKLKIKKYTVDQISVYVVM